jgi:Mrp family chromosome partitioning ATPase
MKRRRQCTQRSQRESRARTRQMRSSETEDGPKHAIIIASWQLKGGVGKSPIALELAHALTCKGKRVGLMDMDAQATLTTQLANAIQGN